MVRGSAPVRRRGYDLGIHTRATVHSGQARPLPRVTVRARLNNMRSIVCPATLGVLMLVFAPAADVGGRGAAWATPIVAVRQHHGPEFDWPLRGEPPVKHAFDPPATNYGSGHRGADLVAESDQPVLAAAAGTVVYAGPLAGRGVISVQHEGGLRTTYEPVDPEVATGEQVRQGQVIGSVTAGHQGCSEQACLHWGVRSGPDYLDPLILVRDEITIELKPWKPTRAGPTTRQ